LKLGAAGITQIPVDTALPEDYLFRAETVQILFVQALGAK
jgi:hypothetical protein